MRDTGTVYFFTGLSGAGKTTIGGLFHQRLKATKPNVVMLDGDEIRVAFGEDVGYTQDERLRWAGRIFRVCKLLSGQGIDVVVCSIAMYDSVRRWNRENILNYKEIYIKVSKDTLLQRNQKGLYTAGKNVVGIDLPFEEPQSPDLVVPNDGGRTPLELVEELERVLYPNIVEDAVDNTAYWNQYYKNRVCSEEPSPFAQYVATLVEPGRRMVELGCGNGRDAVFSPPRGWISRRWICPRRRSPSCRAGGSPTRSFCAAISSIQMSTSRRATTTPTAASPSTPSTATRSRCC